MTKITQILKIPDLRKKIFTVLALLGLFRLLAAIPIPGVDVSRLQEFFSSNEFFGFLDIFSGGGLSNLSVVMLGVGPYITAVIIMQLLTIIFPRLKKAYYEEGAEGRAKFNRYSRYATVPLAALQSYGFLNLLISQGIIEKLSLSTTIANVIIITAGSVLLMWIGELISEYNIGNGISILIFAGIIASLPQSIISSLMNYSPEKLPTYVAFVFLAVFVIAAVTYINEGERKVPVSYTKQVRGNKLYGGASTYLPLKINQAGVIPIIFAISVLLFPQFFAQIAGVISQDFAARVNEWVNNIFNNIFLYSGLYFLLVVLFTYFYTSITFDPGEISKTLQQSGGFIPGIRPGQNTTNVIKKIVHRITLFGAIFLGLVAVLPNLTQIATGIQTFAIGGASLLIVVAVALEVMKKVESQLTMREYEGL